MSDLTPGKTQCGQWSETRHRVTDTHQVRHAALHCVTLLSHRTHYSSQHTVTQSPDKTKSHVSPTQPSPASVTTSTQPRKTSQSWPRSRPHPIRGRCVVTLTNGRLRICTAVGGVQPTHWFEPNDGSSLEIGAGVCTSPESPIRPEPECGHNQLLSRRHT